GGARPRGGIYLGRTSGVSSIALQGASAPGGGTFSGFLLPVLNNSGQAAFKAAITSNGQGIFIGDGTDLVKAVVSGDSLAGSTVTSVALSTGSQSSGQSPLND